MGRLTVWCTPLLAACLLGPVGMAAAQTAPDPARTTRRMETLKRGIVAVKDDNKVFVSWRLLTTDATWVSFDVYRQENGGAAVKLNSTPISSSTNWVDQTADFTKTNTYFVRAVQNGGGSQANSEVATLWNQNYMRLVLQQPAGGTVGTGTSASTYTYSPADCSTGDLDGDGEYEIIVKWDPSNARDNASSGFSGNVILDAYKLDGTRLWRIDLGRNIRAGAHYTQFMVYDLDGDGRAELACKTSDATVDGRGNVIGNATADYRNAGGYILSGPEYLTIFNGQTGAAMASTPTSPNATPLPATIQRRRKSTPCGATTMATASTGSWPPWRIWMASGLAW